ncbi:uncharacterized protein V6R79_006048 [Siganus canaliculatus]
MDSWCCFGRTRVTLDTGSGHVTARAQREESVSTFIVLLRWTFQEKRHLLRNIESNRDVDFSSDSDNDLDSADLEHDHFQYENQISSD